MATITRLLTSRRQAARIVVVATTAMLGVAYLTATSAVVNLVAVEAEAGALAGNAGLIDAAQAPGTSSGQAVRFGSLPSSGACADTRNVAKPPAGGYFQLKPPGSFNALPDDVQAASQVNCSKWEPRPTNVIANNMSPTGPLPKVGDGGMHNADRIFGRVTGNFKGTTDEIIQWAAIKWGLSDEMIRAEAVSETSWYQGVRDANGQPKQGYGDYGDCPATTRYPASGPASYGLMQVKWCKHNAGAGGGYGPWPLAEDSTAYNVDYFGSIIRGCYEGWDYVDSTGGDIWGCVGRWYSGKWHDADAEAYIAGVKNNLSEKAWLKW